MGKIVGVEVVPVLLLPLGELRRVGLLLLTGLPFIIADGVERIAASLLSRIGGRSVYCI